jgi:hypothetical protein
MLAGTSDAMARRLFAVREKGEFGAEKRNSRVGGGKRRPNGGAIDVSWIDIALVGLRVQMK